MSKRDKMSVEQAVREIMAFVDAVPIAGRREPSEITIEQSIKFALGKMGSGISLSWERGWAGSSTIALRFDKDGGLEVEVGWSGTTHGPIGASVAAKLHTEVADLALALQHHFAHLRVDPDRVRIEEA